MKKVLLLIALFVASLICTILLYWLRGGYVSFLGLSGFPLSMFVFSVVFFALTLFALVKFGPQIPAWAIVLVIVLGTSPGDLYLHLRPGMFCHTLISLPDYLMRIAAVLVAWLCFGVRCRNARVLVAVLFLGFSLCCSYFGFPLYQKAIGQSAETVSTVCDTETVR